MFEGELKSAENNVMDRGRIKFSQTGYIICTAICTSPFKFNWIAEFLVTSLLFKTNASGETT